MEPCMEPWTHVHGHSEALELTSEYAVYRVEREHVDRVVVWQ